MTGARVVFYMVLYIQSFFFETVALRSRPTFGLDGAADVLDRRGGQIPCAQSRILRPGAGTGPTRTACRHDEVFTLEPAVLRRTAAV